ncbi:catalase-like [Atheta coriaria]|uniref:catalase-like n=1 Tax=Dalotia coriaria TaxID=877792 RepID=UPI0031F35582
MNAFWDFISLRPETTHQVLILMSDRGIPDGHRHMHGYGSHTFALMNSNEEKTYCKFHFKTQQGIKNLPVKDAERLAGSSPDYAQKDLYNAIEGENFPKWKLYIQTMTEAQSQSCSFDPFDVTKVWPQGDYPLQSVGEFVLNKNPENYFSEVEQLSFSPGAFIPGIGPSQDRMLLGRIFSYPDAHLYRLGSNFTQLPVNAAYHVKNFQRDGVDTIDNQGGAPNYHPNSFGGPKNKHSAKKTYPTIRVSGNLGRYDLRDADNFSQARVFYRSTIEEPERQRIADNIVGGLKFAIKPIQARTIDMFSQVDEDLGRKISKGLRGENLSVTL